MAIYKHSFPIQRAATKNLKPVGRCIYCPDQGADPELTDEHIVPDGLGGDFVLPKSSCRQCAKATSRAETHLIREVLEFWRSVAEVQSRKRKPRVRTARVQYENAAEEVEVRITKATPSMFPFPITDGLPGFLSGYPPGFGPPVRLALFGPRDGIDQARKWLGGSGSIETKFRLNVGMVGQALAKIAHSYTCAKIGVDTFDPFLTEYILANEPPFDSHHIGIHDSAEGHIEALHLIDLMYARVHGAPDLVYVVYLRLFAHWPSPSILVVVGRPRGGLAPFITELHPPTLSV